MVLPAERFYTDGPAIWTATELIEAAVRCGQPERARRAFERVQETTRAAGTDWALGIEARLRALLSDDDHADELYMGTISRLGRTGIRVQLARIHGAVKGIDGLRVIDASIIPVVPSGAINPTTIMIAERIAKAVYASESGLSRSAVEVIPTA